MGEKEFDRLFELAKEYQKIEFGNSDYYNTIDHANRKGREEGREEEKLEIAKNLFANGVSYDIIKTSTRLTDAQLTSIAKEVQVGDK